MTPPRTTAPARGCAAALAGLPGMTPGRLRRALAAASPDECWASVVGRGPVPGLDGRVPPPLRRRWREEASHRDTAEAERALDAAGIDVVVLGEPGYPQRLGGDANAPSVLFTRGAPCALARATVGIVGTRRCTGYGRSVAADLGAGLAESGVTVVSGLAQGVDAAAQRAALTAGGLVVGVAGSGLDVVYPRSSVDLWQAVTTAGLLVSEAAPGTPPEAWRFPLRNRIIAGLSDVVVVVESHSSGGALHTVDAAAARAVPVMAVPGPVTSPASAGTNGLLADGCAVARDADDVLALLGLGRFAAGLPEADLPKVDAGREPDGDAGREPDVRREADVRPGADVTPADRRQRGGAGIWPADVGATELTALAAVDWVPTSVEAVLCRTGLSPQRALLALERLRSAGLVDDVAGWWERRALSGRDTTLRGD